MILPHHLPLSLAAITGFSWSPACDMSVLAILSAMGSPIDLVATFYTKVCLQVCVDGMQRYLATRGLHAYVRMRGRKVGRAGDFP